MSPKAKPKGASRGLCTAHLVGGPQLAAATAPGERTWFVRGMCEGVGVDGVASDEFERLVVAELDLLPDEMFDGLENVAFVTEDRPEDGSLDLLGLYDGVSLTERGQYGFGELPDRIILYREPHLAQCADLDELRDEIHVTLVHEIGHYYGFDDDKLHELGWA